MELNKHLFPTIAIADQVEWAGMVGYCTVATYGVSADRKDNIN
jgi:hypothetical protein